MATDKARHLIENVFAKIKQFRAIATRYDKIARDFYMLMMTGGLLQAGAADVAMEVPQGAERRALLQRTAPPSGYPPDSRDKQYGFWSRLDLHEAVLAATK